MKNFYLILFCISLLQMSYAQDTIVFSDGSIRDVKINAVDTLNQTIHYVRKNTSYTISNEEIISYKFNGIWYARENQSNQFSVSENSFYQIKPHFFLKPAKHTYSKYSISIAYSPSSSAFGENLERRLFIAQFSNNATLRIEPEYLIHPKVSIKIPLVLGLGIESAPYEIFNEQSDYYYYNQPYFYFSAPTYPLAPEVNSRNPQEQSLYFNNYKPVHKSELLYQIGITPKFYPFGQTRNALYISQSINWGRGNYNSVDYYYDFDTLVFTDYWTGDQSASWYLTSERARVTKNQFNYFRFETLVGINFNVSSSLCFSIESGFSSIMQNNGKTEDRVFLKAPGEDYQLIYSGVYQVNPDNEVINPAFNYNYNSFWSRGFIYSGKFINRIHLVYKFGGKRLESKIKPN